MTARSDRILSASRQVKEQYLRELLDRMNRGEGVSKSELDIISKLEVDLSDGSPELRDGFITNVKGVAAFFDVSQRTIQLWVKDGTCPRMKHGMYDLKEVFGWWLENVHEVKTTSDEAENAKSRYWVAKAERERLRVDTEKGKLIPETDILPEWTARVAEVCAGLQSLGSRIDLKIDGKPRGERKRIIDEEVWKLRDNFCRNGKFCPQVEPCEV